MSVIVFATGGTTENSRIVEHPWDNYQFVTSTAAKALSPLFRDLSVSSVANCLGAGNLWGGFLFAHEICRLLQVKYYPFASIVDIDSLCESIDRFSIDTIICLPSFFERILYSDNRNQLSSLRNIFYLGEMFSDSLVDKVHTFLPKACIKPLAYTSQETGPIGFQCSSLSGNEYHIYEHVELSRNPSNRELSVTVRYPGQNHLYDHNMSDVGELEQDILCSCGYRGNILHLHGRVPTSRNILGTSISIFEFVRVLAAVSGEQVTEDDLQLIEIYSERKDMSLVLMISNSLEILPSHLYESLNSSPLIKELIGKSVYFDVVITDRNHFLKSEVTQKIKKFILSNSIPDIEGAVKISIK
ncbi:hypothetical protein [Dickeya lacustris]|uniref:AMP-dependent synthetase/ligase domain-containing protein n=1 Tax=Dickeya lacustris TaxID=2259638 RepID=A0ABY8GA19_9GAMM|nr:hypothetical protein [Dickeya lacustris]WFN56811.1 hypothetical protein O1Q98_06005 [Dickeya lacustris]